MDGDSETKRMLAGVDKEIENQGELGQVDVSNPHHLHSRVTMPGGDDTTPPKRRSMSVPSSIFNGSEEHPAMSTRVAARFRRSVDLSHSNSKSTQSQPGPYDKFKTRAGSFSRSLERQFSRVSTPRAPRTPDASVSIDEEQGGVKEGEQRQVVAEGDRNGRGDDEINMDRYLDALEGPELEAIKEGEMDDLMLPPDEKWPFLLRFPIGCFGVALGLGSQTILWKSLSQTQAMVYFHIPIWISLCLWCTALLALVFIFFTYLLKIIFYFEAVRREYHHPVRVNFFFAPWIAGMFLVIGVPPLVATTIHPAAWCVLMAPIFILELKIYGQWLSGGERRLSQVANPSTHLSVVGNFIGAILGATVGWREPALFFFAVGLAHYLVLFVTLYQRLPTNETLPKDLHPVFFLFVAAPSAASVAWMRITGQFDYVSKVIFFIALFLYLSLIVRVNFFRGFRFSISWWAYTFPMTAAAIAAIQYANVESSWFTRILAFGLSIISTITVFILFCSTLLHAFYWRSLFPNDMAIAITAHKPKNFLQRVAPSSLDDGCGIDALQTSTSLVEAIIAAYNQLMVAREEQGLSIDDPLSRSLRNSLPTNSLSKLAKNNKPLPNRSSTTFK